MVEKLNKKEAMIEIYNKIILKYEKELEEEITEYNKQKIVEAYEETMQIIGEELKEDFPVQYFIEGKIQENMTMDARSNKIKSLQKSVASLTKLRDNIK